MQHTHAASVPGATPAASGPRTCFALLIIICCIYFNIPEMLNYDTNNILGSSGAAPHLHAKELLTYSCRQL